MSRADRTRRHKADRLAIAVRLLEQAQETLEVLPLVVPEDLFDGTVLRARPIMRELALFRMRLEDELAVVAELQPGDAR